MRSAPGRVDRPLRVYVSASSRGVAFEIARQFSVDGAHVAMSSRSSENLAEARKRILRDAPAAQLLAIPADLTDPAGQAQVLYALEASGFAPDVFVCSAGHPSDAPLSSLERGEWTANIEMILGQAVFAVQKFAPAMAAQGYGRLIFLSSITAKAPDRRYFMSSLARPGLFSLSKMVSDEYSSKGVAAFVICLGFTDTPLLRNLALGLPQDDPDPEMSVMEAWRGRYEEWAGDIPANRIASPEELGQVVRFLATPEAEYMSGTVLSFSGGLDRGLV